MKRVLEAVQAKRVNVRGVVQGVGFRPFVYRIACQNHLTGHVYNTSGDVTIVIEGSKDGIQSFLNQLQHDAPPQARIESVNVTESPVAGYGCFEIKPSLAKAEDYQLISPDLATCKSCREEIFSIGDRRYRYPFTNCTNCGPRFTIIEDIPYDRPRTTMRDFKMCPRCQQEYDDPADRRFHAQPNACPVCGPRLIIQNSRCTVQNSITKEKRGVVDIDVIVQASQLLKSGKILAIKGMGGFLLACDATNDDSVRLLRDRKKRLAKPFAVMVKNLEQAQKYCFVSAKEEELLTSTAAPIVLLEMKPGTDISPEIAPGLKNLGLMLPYTPLHHLLLTETDLPLVMTSGNLSEEPIAKDNEEALQRLSGIADYFVLHNRDIYSRYDDSVVMALDGGASKMASTHMVRRARGYAPYPIHLPFTTRSVLACGAELKNTFCLTHEKHAFISQHIGDMENQETLDHFEDTLQIYQKMFRIRPEVIACDMHPDYLPTKWAQNEAIEKGLSVVPVQHHHAHIVSCMVENAIREPVIGVAFDGTGYGTDGKIWGGEFMIADYSQFRRVAHLEYLPLPGGSVAIVRPYRIAIGYLYALLGRNPYCSLLLSPPRYPVHSVGKSGEREEEIDLIYQQIARSLNAPLTSSAGRLFDAVSALLGIRQEVSYEGQAAAELEALAARDLTTKSYPFNTDMVDGMRIIRLKDLFEAIVTDWQNTRPISEISTRFHCTVASLIGEVSSQISKETGIKQVALSGGVFQNRLLFGLTIDELKKRELVPLVHELVPCNDGGISLGQAVVANFCKI